MIQISCSTSGYKIISTKNVQYHLSIRIYVTYRAASLPETASVLQNEVIIRLNWFNLTRHQNTKLSRPNLDNRKKNLKWNSFIMASEPTSSDCCYKFWISFFDSKFFHFENIICSCITRRFFWCFLRKIWIKNKYI